MNNDDSMTSKLLSVTETPNEASEDEVGLPAVASVPA